MAGGTGGRTVLRIDSGADHPGSVTRNLAGVLIDRLVEPGDALLQREATQGVLVVTGAWVAASFSDGDPVALATSDALVDELLSADELVLVAPIYNFGIPAAMKAWIDQVVRAGRTFQFTEAGPVGLVPATRAWVVTASAGTQVGSDLDFNTSYLRAILGFIGISDVRVIAADNLQVRGEAAVADALAQIEALSSRSSA